MTAVSTTPPALERYLRRATAGLPPTKRQEVWDELEEHIYCRAEQLEWQGASPEQALAQAIAELGPPLRVSAGMNGVHNMPKMIAFGAVGILAISAGLYAMAGGETAPRFNAQTTAPRQLCVPQGSPTLSLERLPSLKGEQCYSDPSGTVQGLFVDANGAVAVLDALGLYHSSAGDFIQYHWPSDLSGYALLDPKLKVSGRPLYNLDTVLPLAFRRSAGRLFLDNANTPAFYNERGLRLNFGAPGSEYVRLIYSDLGQLAASSVYGLDTSQGFITTELKRTADPLKTIQTGLRAGEMVGAFRWVSSATESEPSQRSQRHVRQTIHYDVGTVDSAGQVKLHIPATAALAQTISQQPSASWVLVHLTNTPLNNLKSGIFLPKQ